MINKRKDREKFSILFIITIRNINLILAKDIGLAVKDSAIDEGLHVEAVLLCDVCMSFVKLVHGVDLNREALVAPLAA